MQQITEDFKISQLFELTPDSVVILENSGLKVTGCDARTERTLKELFAHHKLESQKTQKILTHLNKLKQIEVEAHIPSKKDQSPQKITEGNKIYYKVAGLMFTETAVKNLESLSENSGLQIRLSAGGCSGFKYDYDFTPSPQADEKVYKLTEKLSIFMNDFTFSRSYGSVVEFKLGLHESGLTIINPNKKRACSCGTSIAF
ncbi:hypothetical protein COU74_02380 [Candidatus Peregrinibacteria bacterium CG10_big_fil_rev_8_21_14_0_10_36_19]|nr:MAG: hypothetical protein COU74_02380 [Candidatus Peregrinibacteria bacterium CG10_big_fil_rev_8_21_14_0_10_36_19]